MKNIKLIVLAFTIFTYSCTKNNNNRILGSDTSDQYIGTWSAFDSIFTKQGLNPFIYLGDLRYDFTIDKRASDKIVLFDFLKYRPSFKDSIHADVLTNSIIVTDLTHTSTIFTVINDSTIKYIDNYGGDTLTRGVAYRQ